LPGRRHGHEFKIDQIVPTACPQSQEYLGLGFHHLETASPLGVHPTRLIGDTLRKHAAAPLEAVSNCRTATWLEAFDDHEEHFDFFTASSPGFSELASRWRCSRATIYNCLRAVGANVLDFAPRGKRGRKGVALGTVLEIELVPFALGVPSGPSLPAAMPPLGRDLSFSSCSIA
jgi:hypothetical protein